MARSNYTPFSSFWYILVPSVLAGILYYGYTTPSWLGAKVQKIADPLVEPVLRFVHRVL